MFRLERAAVDRNLQETAGFCLCQDSHAYNICLSFEICAESALPGRVHLGPAVAESPPVADMNLLLLLLLLTQPAKLIPQVELFHACGAIESAVLMHRAQLPLASTGLKSFAALLVSRACTQHGLVKVLCLTADHLQCHLPPVTPIVPKQAPQRFDKARDNQELRQCSKLASRTVLEQIVVAIS